MDRLDARYIGIVTSRDGQYNGIPAIEVVRQMREQPQLIQDEFVEGMLRQELEKCKNHILIDKAPDMV